MTSPYREVTAGGVVYVIRPADQITDGQALSCRPGAESASSSGEFRNYVAYAVRCENPQSPGNSRNEPSQSAANEHQINSIVSQLLGGVHNSRNLDNGHDSDDGHSSENGCAPDNGHDSDGDHSSDNDHLSENDRIPENSHVPDNSYAPENSHASDNCNSPNNSHASNNGHSPDDGHAPDNILSPDNGCTPDNGHSTDNVNAPDNSPAQYNDYVSDHSNIKSQIIADKTPIFCQIADIFQSSDDYKYLGRSQESDFVQIPESSQLTINGQSELPDSVSKAIYGKKCATRVVRRITDISDNLGKLYMLELKTMRKTRFRLVDDSGAQYVRKRDSKRSTSMWQCVRNQRKRPVTDTRPLRKCMARYKQLADGVLLRFPPANPHPHTCETENSTPPTHG